eukprot:GHUV01018026.1.p1 GENE.GHUV01018026.1~~GHUV01018026.1.p1  ORF type:complete len:186 (+),score=75.96 GHUV01018026.1:610-1167(+)
MDFKAECTAGDQIECFGMPLTDCANGNGSTQQFLHLLRKGGSDVEVWRARTTWTPRAAAAAAAAEGAVGSGVSLPGSSHISNGKTRPCNTNNGSSAVHLNGRSTASSSSKTAASCSQTDCSNANCSNHQTGAAAQADSQPTIVPAESAPLAESQAGGGPGVLQQEPDPQANTAAGARKKGWFKWW